MRRVKIVCTIGPASSSPDAIEQLIDAGMNVARLNFSHGDYDHHREAFETIRATAARMGQPVAILADLCGPKIRLGEIEEGGVEIQSGDSIVLTTDEIVGTPQRVGTNYEPLPRDVKPGDAIFVDDGLLELEVLESEGRDVHCKIRAGGKLRSRKGLNIPRAGLSTPALTEKDKADITFCRGIGVDFFALSFVRRPEDVTAAKERAGDIPVIAKIEKPDAIDHLEAIAEIADGLMVARGDLGVEVGFEKVPMLQKRMIRVMNRRAKPVITATQMLESMINNPQPTRAEVSDVANAVLDGTDAVMLSAESAVGRYPRRTVEMMSRIVREVEGSATSDETILPATHQTDPDFRNAVAHAAARAAIDLDLATVAVFTRTGRTARYLSAYRPHSLVIAFCYDDQTRRRLALQWGIRSVLCEKVNDGQTAARLAERRLKDAGIVEPGDKIAVVIGPSGQPFTTSTLRLWRVGADPDPETGASSGE
ncbi:Pyruvate kinase [Planctomycetes bacterium Pan216]|uniref:Pyruvate kinase n=1 Tax=Kolteria novifilia TaxID=2527975 RepID=A0A518AZB2_9BACT|nr:Pyruvate kinase [Planctomycetes bacterium Pan216]